MLDFVQLKEDFQQEIGRADSSKTINDIKTKYLGKKSRLKNMFKELKSLSKEAKIQRAKDLNKVSQLFEEQINYKAEQIANLENNNSFAKERVDVSLPGLFLKKGALHPVTIVENQCLDVLRQLGFSVEEGPEIEMPYYNFDALNIPKHHPARDLQDTFWVQGGLVLRSHTTSIQARVLEEGRDLPIKVAAAGRVFRNEKVDASHLAMFHQLEGFWVDKNLNLTHLKGVLLFVAKELYGQSQKFRFKPKFYPYTEPSLGLDIQCTSCSGAGCSACHDAGWVTIMGAGMIHTNVLKQFGYDKKGIRGIAFGWGTTRVTSQWLGLPRVRELYSQDQRFFRAVSRRTVQ